MKKCGNLIWLLLGSMLLTLASCGGTAGTTPASRESLVVSIASDPATFDLLYANTLVEGVVANNIYDCLFHFEEDGSVTPWLGERYEVSDNALEYTFFLRKGVLFHNGEEFTARDVAFTIEYGRGTPNGSAVCDLVESTEIIDDYTILVRIFEPMSSFLYQFAGDQLAIYNETAVRSAVPYGAFPIGTGPYKYVRREPGVEVELAANDEHFMGAPAIKTVLFRVIPDDFTASVALETGDIDMIWIANSASAEVLRNSPGFTVYSSPSTRVNFFVMNVEKPPFNDVRLRRAVNYAIDREVIRDIAYEGDCEVKDFIAMPWMAGYAVPEYRYAYDPDMAISLARSAGVSRDSPIPVTLITTAANQRVAVILQQQLAEIGISLSIEMMEFNTWVTNQYAGDFQISAGGQYIMVQDMNYLMRFYDSSYINQGNSARYSDPRVDRLFTEGRRETDLAKRRELYYELQNIVQEAAPYAVFASPAIIRIFKEDLIIGKVYPNGIFLRDLTWQR